MRLRGGLAAVVLVAASQALPPAAEGRPAHMYAVPAASTLTIGPLLDGTAELTADTIESTDALPDYVLTLTQVSTGAAVGTDYGYAETNDLDEYESNWGTATSTPLSVGTLYQATLLVRTVGYYACSIYDKNGCSWVPAGTEASEWRFVYAGVADQQATRYKPKVKVVLGQKRPWGDHGWTIAATLKSDGVVLPHAKVTGQNSSPAGPWAHDRTWRTDKHGRLVLTFVGADGPTRYRFAFPGSLLAPSAHSSSFYITRRR